MTGKSLQIGLGDFDARLRIYVANPPPLPEIIALQTIQPLVAGQVQAIGQQCGNGWRKVFNVYSKLVFALPPTFPIARNEYHQWQDWRDSCLLQSGSCCALLFSPPDLTRLTDNEGRPVIHIIAGRQHARALIDDNQLHSQLVWLNEEFALDAAQHLLVCPYLDYRQLSNEKIAKVSALLTPLLS